MIGLEHHTPANIAEIEFPVVHQTDFRPLLCTPVLEKRPYWEVAAPGRIRARRRGPIYGQLSRVSQQVSETPAR